MPDGGRSFYTDSGEGENYFSYVSSELVEYTRALFPLSRDREKTFAAGNSMGGYGAVKCALTRPDTFGACVTLSGALDLVIDPGALFGAGFSVIFGLIAFFL